jgi:hypothetical protein
LKKKFKCILRAPYAHKYFSFLKEILFHSYKNVSAIH